MNGKPEVLPLLADQPIEQNTFDGPWRSTTADGEPGRQTTYRRGVTTLP